MTEALLDDAVLLLRRAGPEMLDPTNSSVRHNAFRVRPSRGELSLSFYDATMVGPEDVLFGAPNRGWGVAGITAGALRVLGFAVDRDPMDTPGRLGPAHVAASPPELRDGQVPIGLRELVARSAQWVIRPDPTA